MEVAGGIHHVTAKAQPPRLLLVHDDDHRRYLELLARETERRGWSVLHFCGMRNHAHWVIETPEPDLGAGMQAIQQGFARYANRRDGASGRVFVERFFNSVVQDSAYFAALLRYVARNPVAAELCRRPGDWPWSAHRYLAGLEPCPPWLDTHRALGLLGGTVERGRASYLELTAEPDDALLERLRGMLPGDRWIVEAVDRHRISPGQVARFLGVSRSGLYKRLAAARRAAEVD